MSQDAVMPPPPVASPLQLTRLTRTEAHARSALAQKVRDCPFAWGPDTWQVTLQPRVDPGVTQVAEGQALARFVWGGAAFEVVADQEAVHGWVAGRFPGLDLPALPDELAAAALEAACEGLLEALGGLRRGPARLERLAPGPAQAQEQAHAFDAQLRCGPSVVRARLATSSLGLMLMAGLVAEMPEQANALVAQDLPLVLRAELGFTWLPAGELATLAPGDTVLMEHVFLTPDGALWLGQHDWGLGVSWDGHALTVIQRFEQGGWAMPYAEDHEDGEDRLDTLAQLPLRVAFDLGERSMSLGEVQALQPGEVIELGRPLAAAVSVRVNGALVAVGELVEVDGRIAVTIGSLVRQAALDAAPAASRAASRAQAGVHGDEDGDEDDDWLDPAGDGEAGHMDDDDDGEDSKR